MPDLREDLPAAVRPRFGQEEMRPFPEDLRQRQVVAGGRARARPHRSAEARSAGVRAMDCYDEGVPAPGLILGVRELAARANAVLNGDGGQVAGADAQKRSGSRGGRLARRQKTEGVKAILAPLSPQDTELGDEQELLPGRLAQRDVEERLGAGPAQPKRSPCLLVCPTRRQVVGRPQLAQDERPVLDPRPEDMIAGVLDGLKKAAEITPIDDSRPFRCRNLH